VYKCPANPHILQYTVGDTLCRQLQNSAEIEFWPTGWLARRRGSEKHPSEGCAGPPLAVKTGRSKIQKWCITETASLNNEERDDEPVDLRQSRKRLSGRKCCSQRKPNAKRFLFADLEPSEPDDRLVDRPVDHTTLLMFNILKNTAIPIEYNSTEAA
jgi:hypothetical protein